MRNFSLEWQIVKQIRERLSVHQAMLDCHVQQGAVDQQRFATAIGFPQRLIQTGADIRFIFLGFRDVRPVSWLVRGQAAANRIDSECEELVERGIVRAEFERAAQ